MKQLLMIILAQFFPLFFLPTTADAVAVDFSKCVSSYQEEKCVQIFSDPLGLGLQFSEKQLVKKFGRPLKIESLGAVEAAEKGVGKKYFFQGLEIWTLTDESSISTYAKIEIKLKQLPNELQIGGLESKLISKMGKGKSKKNYREYCDEEGNDCLRFFLEKGKIQKIEWLPYSG